MSGDGEIVSALSVGSERNKGYEANYLLPYHHLNRHSDEMESSFLCLPIGHRRARSKARSEIGSTEDQSEAGQAVPRPTVSTPDLQVDTSTSPSSKSLTPRDQESSGM